LSVRRNMTTGALSDLKVVELGSMVSAPFCTKLLASLGAEVIKIEKPGTGDDARRIGPFRQDNPDPECSGLFLYLNAGKLGVTLNLETDGGLSAFRALIRDADILVENNLPREMERLGLTYEELQAPNPGLIMTSITPFGYTGPYRDYQATDLISFHAGGLGYITPRPVVGLPDKGPLRARGHIADFIAGLDAAAGTLCALYERDRSGTGQHLDISEQESVAVSVATLFAGYSYTGNTPARVGAAPYQPVAMLPCKDGYVDIQCMTDEQWMRLVEVMGDPDWAHLDIFKDVFSRAENWQSLQPLLADWLSTRGKHEFYLEAQAKRVPSAPVNTVEDIVGSDHLAARGFFVESEHPVAGTLTYPGPLMKLSGTPQDTAQRAPLLGEHNESVLGGRLGYSREDLSRVRNAVVVEHEQGDGATGVSALTGLRVLDFSWVWAGPICTMLLADMGAEVIKIESNRRLDTSRIVPPFPDGIQKGLDSGGQFNTYNRSKKSCTLDLTQPEAKEIARELVKVSDVVVENFSAGVMTRLGLGYEHCRAVKPDIIYLSLSGYGATGPCRDYVSYGMQLQAFSGLASLTGYMGGPPRNLGTPISDTVGGLSGVIGILAALHHRDITGEGQNIDVSQCEVLVALCPEAVLDYMLNGRVQGPAGNHDGTMAPHGVYRCKGENNWVAIAVTTEAEWQAFCEVIGRPDLPGDPRFGSASLRCQHQEELDAIASAWTVQHSDYNAMHTIQAAGVPASAVLSNAQMVHDPHLAARKFIVEDDHPATGKRAISGFSWRLSRTPGQVQGHAPLMGQHNESVLRGLLGISRERFQELMDRRVIY